MYIDLAEDTEEPLNNEMEERIEEAKMNGIYEEGKK